MKLLTGLRQWQLLSVKMCMFLTQLLPGLQAANTVVFSARACVHYDLLRWH